MAKTKKKNNIKITNVKINNATLKKGVKTSLTNINKSSDKKIKTDVVDKAKKIKVSKTKPVVKKSYVKNQKNYKRKTGKGNSPKIDIAKVKTEKVESVVDIEKEKIVEEVTKEEKINNITSEEVVAKRKERNRKKYEKGQKKYRENQEKKKIVVDDGIKEDLAKKEEIVSKSDVPQIERTIKKEKPEETNEIEVEELVKKTKSPEIERTLKKEKKEERKEKRKTNVKTSGFTQTISNIKEVSVNKINDVIEKTNDNSIPLGKTFDEKSKRSKRLIKEAIFYAILLTIINVLCITIFDYFNFLRLFDVKALNIILTIVISLIFNFFVAFMVDYFVTTAWASNRRKKKDGEPDGDSRPFKGKNKKNIKNKE